MATLSIAADWFCLSLFLYSSITVHSQCVENPAIIAVCFAGSYKSPLITVWMISWSFILLYSMLSELFWFSKYALTALILQNNNLKLWSTHFQILWDKNKTFLWQVESHTYIRIHTRTQVCVIISFSLQPNGYFLFVSKWSLNWLECGFTSAFIPRFVRLIKLIS